MYIASAEGASENVRVLCWTTEYDILFSNVQGKAGASAPLSPPPCSGRRARDLRDVVRAMTCNDGQRKCALLEPAEDELRMYT